MKIIFTIVLSLTALFIYGQSSYQIADSTKAWNTVGIGFWSFGVAYCSGTTNNKFNFEA